jgi:hypothetical protein
VSIITAIYNHLVNDTRLDSLLTRSSLDPTKPAIYDEWATNETNLPYLCLSFSLGNSEIHFAKQETLLNIDIFTETNSILAEDIKEACIFALDRQTIIDDSDGAFIRCYYNRDGQITEPADGITHWNIEISLHHWRNSFIQHLIDQ